MSKPKPPEVLDAIADVVLAYHPKPKTKAGKKRKRLARKLSSTTQKVDRAEKEREH
jgi:hypothetical protein